MQRARRPAAKAAAGARAATRAGRPTFSGSAEAPRRGRGAGRDWAGAGVRAPPSPLRRRGPFVHSPRAVRPAPCAPLCARSGWGSRDQPSPRPASAPDPPRAPRPRPAPGLILSTDSPHSLPGPAPCPDAPPDPAHPLPLIHRLCPPSPWPHVLPGLAPSLDYPPHTRPTLPPTAPLWTGPAPARGTLRLGALQHLPCRARLCPPQPPQSPAPDLATC